MNSGCNHATYEVIFLCNFNINYTEKLGSSKMNGQGRVAELFALTNQLTILMNKLKFCLFVPSSTPIHWIYFSHLIHRLYPYYFCLHRMLLSCTNLGIRSYLWATTGIKTLHAKFSTTTLPIAALHHAFFTQTSELPPRKLQM